MHKMQRFALHPGTKLLIALCYVLSLFWLPLIYQAIFVLAGWLSSFVIIKPLQSQDPGRIFFRLWLTAGFFLTIIHSISYDGGLIFNPDGLMVGGRYFFRIGILMVTFLWLIRTIKAEELYSFLIDLRLPVPIIYVIFQTIYLVPRFGEKAKEILIAQQARGFVLKGIKNRIKALVLILSPLFSTLIFELEESAAAITARGLHAQGRKVHLAKIQFSAFDIMIIIFSIGITAIIMAIVI